MGLTNDDLQAIAKLMRVEIRDNSNLVLGELDRVEQRINKRFDKVDQDMQKMREDIHTTKYSNDTVELLLHKVTELEKRVDDLEHTA